MDWTNVKLHIVWLLITTLAVIFAMLCDLISGIRKAKQRGEATTSTGLKRTADKATKYFLPMMCLMSLDLLASNLCPVPACAMLWAAFCIICEFKSVCEKAHTKKEMHEAAQTMNVIVKNKEDIAKILAQVVQEMADKKKEDKHD